MTGTERLRELAKDTCKIYLWGIIRAYREDKYDTVEGDGKTLNGLLCEIADQIELEDEQGCDVETVRHDAYEAWEWVRAHGGLDHVKAEWRSRVPYDKHEKRRRRLLDHIAECEAALGRRRVRIEELGHRVRDLANENAELRRRAMPEGYEWPRYEDGSPVVLSERDQRPGTVSGVAFVYHAAVIDYRSPFVEINPLVCEMTGTRIMNMGERVRRPAVPAADGEPLEVGQTVWDTDAEDDTPLTVVEVSSDLVRCEYTWKDGKTYRPCYPPSVLTHTKPEIDSWERVEEDIAEGFMATEETTRDLREEARDIVRRCRALAERERGE